MAKTLEYEKLAKKYRQLKIQLSKQKNTGEQLADLKEQHTALIDLLLDGVYIHDIKGNFTDANQAILDMLGYSRDEVHTINFGSLLDKTQLTLAMRLLEKLSNSPSQPETTEYRLEKKNGDKIWVESRASLLFKDNQPFAVMGVVRDISKRKHIEEKLRFSEGNNKNAGQNQGAFLSKVSQKLLIGLRHVIGLPKEGIMGIGKFSNEKLKTNYKRINELGNNTSKTICKDPSFSTNSDLDNIENFVAKHKLLTVVKHIVREIKETDLNKEVSFMVIKPKAKTTIECDIKKLKEAIQILLLHATRFIHKGKKIVISFEKGTLIINNIRVMALKIIISDQGISVPQEALDRMFNNTEPGEKSDKQIYYKKSQFSSCERIINAHKGKIFASNNSNGGVRFSIILPYMQNDTCTNPSQIYAANKN